VFTFFVPPPHPVLRRTRTHFIPTKPHRHAGRSIAPLPTRSDPSDTPVTVSCVYATPPTTRDMQCTSVVAPFFRTSNASVPDASHMIIHFPVGPLYHH